MRFFDLVSIIASNLSRRKGRVVLTAIGVVIGTAAVVLLVSLAIGLQQSATSQLYGISDLRRIEVYPNYDTGGGGGGGGVVYSDKGQIPGSSEAKLLTPKALEELAALPGVEYVIPRDYLYYETHIVSGKLETWGQIIGIGTDNLANLGDTAETGVTTLERGTAIIGGWAARNFYDPKWRPGQDEPEQPELLNKQIKLVIYKYTSDGQMVKKSINLRIVGILPETRSESDSALYVRLDEMTPWSEWASGTRINRNKDGYPNVIVQVADPEQVLDVAEQINALGYMAYTPQSYLESINSFFLILQLIFGGVGAIALLVAAIGIANTMTMAILERTREIGLMKAIGATNRDVLSIFLGESAGIGLLGGMGGAALGWLAAQGLNVVALNYLAQQAAEGGMAPPESAIATPVWLILFAVIFATLVGLLSGLYPSLRAATIVPVNALKYE